MVPGRRGLGCGQCREVPGAAAADLAAAAPGNVTATSTGPRTIMVTWTETSSGVTAYNVDNGCPVSPSYTCGGTDASVSQTIGSAASAEFSVTPGAYDCFRVQTVGNPVHVGVDPVYASVLYADTAACDSRDPRMDRHRSQPFAWRPVVIKAIGRIYISPAVPEGPEGDPACEAVIAHPAVSAAFPAPTLPCWSLVGRIRSGPPFEIGNSTLVITTSGCAYNSASMTASRATRGAGRYS